MAMKKSFKKKDIFYLKTLDENNCLKILFILLKNNKKKYRNFNILFIKNYSLIIDLSLIQRKIHQIQPIIIVIATSILLH